MAALYCSGQLQKRHKGYLSSQSSLNQWSVSVHAVLAGWKSDSKQLTAELHSGECQTHPVLFNFHGHLQD